MIGAGLFVLKGEANLQVRCDTYLLRQPPGETCITGTTPVRPTATTRWPYRKERLPGWARKKPAETRQGNASGPRRLAEAPRRNSSVEEALADLLKRGKERHFTGRLLTFVWPRLNDLPRLIDALANDSSAMRAWRPINALRHWIGVARGE